MTANELLEILKRDAVDIFSTEGLKEKLESGKKLKIKYGADPSRPDLHIGHSVVLKKLKLFQQLGHEVIFVIGDFTAMIGDPTGRSKTRPCLTLEQTRESGKTYFEQVIKILDPQKTSIVYNSQWLSCMNFADVIKLAEKYTLARILERNDFSKRFKENQPIGLHEMLYPLVVGYDSVALGADIEIGGTDQTFNLLVGRELQTDYGQIPQVVITFPLLPGLDGAEKMGKSLDNYIGLNEPAEIMFEKAMKVPDNILLDYFHLTLDYPLDKSESLIKSDIRNAHFVYATELVKIYHSHQSADNACKRYIQIASGAMPENIKTVKYNVQSITLTELLKAVDFAKSNSDAKRLIEGRGIKINNVITDNVNAILDENEFTVSKGKSKIVRIILSRK
jgi:tyrosyl-tRNA synthetase